MYANGPHPPPPPPPKKKKRDEIGRSALPMPTGPVTTLNRFRTTIELNLSLNSDNNQNSCTKNAIKEHDESTEKTRFV